MPGSATPSDCSLWSDSTSWACSSRNYFPSQRCLSSCTCNFCFSFCRRGGHSAASFAESSTADHWSRFASTRPGSSSGLAKAVSTRNEADYHVFIVPAVLWAEPVLCFPWRTAWSWSCWFSASSASCELCFCPPCTHLHSKALVSLSSWSSSSLLSRTAQAALTLEPGWVLRFRGLQVLWWPGCFRNDASLNWSICQETGPSSLSMYHFQPLYCIDGSSVFTGFL